MSIYPDDDRTREIKLLRDQIARLIGQNLELQRQLEELKRERMDVPIETVAAVTVRSIRAAEKAIAEETPEGNRYRVAELQTTLRGFLIPSQEQLAFRLPFPENAVPSGQLGTLAMTIAQIPPTVSVPVETHPASPD